MVSNSSLRKGDLGGQLNFSDYVAFKYSLNKCKKFLIRQIEKSNVKVCLNTEANGAAQKLAAGTVVIAVSMEPKRDEARALYDTGDRFSIVGDCNVASNIQKAMRSAFSTASML